MIHILIYFVNLGGVSEILASDWLRANLSENHWQNTWWNAPLINVRCSFILFIFLFSTSSILRNYFYSVKQMMKHIGFSSQSSWQKAEGDGSRHPHSDQLTVCSFNFICWEQIIKRHGMMCLVGWNFSSHGTHQESADISSKKLWRLHHHLIIRQISTTFLIRLLILISLVNLFNIYIMHGIN